MEHSQKLYDQTFGTISSLLLFKSQLVQKYTYFAKQAKKDGFEQISAIFTETLTQQTNHVKTLFRLLEGSTAQCDIAIPIPKIGSTPENLKDAVSSENQIMLTISEVLPIAWEAGLKKEHTKLKLFLQISEFYENRFRKLLSNIENDSVFRKEEKVKWICRKCGLIYESERALHNCPGCEHPQAYFEIFVENY